MCVPLSGWTRCICAVCGVQYIPIYILISHTHTSASASPWGTDGRVASSLLIITVCDLARGKAGRRRVHWGMQLSWERRRAAGQHEKHWSSQSGLPVWCQSTPRPGLLFEGRNFVFFPLSLSLSLFSQLPCVPSWTLFLWKRSRETVQDMARAQKRRELFVHLEKEVGMDEILLWLDADRHSFWAERQNHTEAQQRMSPWGIRALLSYLLSAEGEKMYFYRFIPAACFLHFIYNLKGNRKSMLQQESQCLVQLNSLKINWVGKWPLLVQSLKCQCKQCNER